MRSWVVGLTCVLALSCTSTGRNNGDGNAGEGGGGSGGGVGASGGADGAGGSGATAARGGTGSVPVGAGGSSGESGANGGAGGDEDGGGAGGCGGSSCGALCGDGKVEGDEPCDDGNRSETDTCTTSCTCGPGLTGPRCQLARFETITPVGTVDGYAYGVNSDGSVVTGGFGNPQEMQLPGLAQQAFRWTSSTGRQPMASNLSVFSSVGLDVNGDGSVIVGRLTTRATTGLLQQRAFRWTAATGMVVLATAPTVSEEARSVSRDGAVIVGITTRYTGTRPFRWSAATAMVDIGIPGLGGAFTDASAVSADGSVIAGRATDGPSDGAATLKESVVSILGAPAGFLASRRAVISENGGIVYGLAGRLAGPGALIQFTAATGLVELDSGTVPIWQLTASSIDGRVVTGEAEDGKVWIRTTTASGARTDILNDVLAIQGVNLDGWRIYVTAISDDGNVIVGYGTPTDGAHTVGWVARYR